MTFFLLFGYILAIILFISLVETDKVDGFGFKEINPRLKTFIISALLVIPQVCKDIVANTITGIFYFFYGILIFSTCIYRFEPKEGYDYDTSSNYDDASPYH